MERAARYRKARKPKKPKNTMKNYYKTVLNFQGMPKNKCVYNSVVGDFVYVPPKYPRPTIYSEFCESCYLLPCVAHTHFPELCRKTAKLIQEENVSTLVVTRRCETMMKGYMRKYFDARYVRENGLPQCVYDALGEIIPRYKSGAPVDVRQEARMEAAVGARAHLATAMAVIDLSADSDSSDDSSLPLEDTDSEEETDSKEEEDSDSVEADSVEAALSIDGSLVVAEDTDLDWDAEDDADLNKPLICLVKPPLSSSSEATVGVGAEANSTVGVGAEANASDSEEEFEFE